MYNEYNGVHGNRKASNLATNIKITSSSTKSKSTSHILNIIRRKFASGSCTSSSSTTALSTSSTSLYELNFYLSNNF